MQQRPKPTQLGNFLRVAQVVRVLARLLFRVCAPRMSRFQDIFVGKLHPNVGPIVTLGCVLDGVLVDRRILATQTIRLEIHFGHGFLDARSRCRSLSSWNTSPSAIEAKTRPLESWREDARGPSRDLKEWEGLFQLSPGTVDPRKMLLPSFPRDVAETLIT